MTEVACNKCGGSLHIEEGAPSGLKVVKCPACNYPNLFSLPLKDQGQARAPTASPARPATQGAARTGGPSQKSRVPDIALGAPGAVPDIPGPKAAPKAAKVELGAPGAIPNIPIPAPKAADDDVELGTPGDSAEPEPEPATAPVPAPDDDDVELGMPGVTPGTRAAGPTPADDDMDLGTSGAASGLPRPAPRSPMAGRAGTARSSDRDLPAPVSARRQPTSGGGPGAAPDSASTSDLPAPVPGRPRRRPTEDIDLPAPRRAATDDGGLPEPRGHARSGPGRMPTADLDLPVPSRASTQDGGPGMRGQPAPAGADDDGGMDLLTPADRDIEDLPRPVSQPAAGGLEEDPFGLDDPFGGGPSLGDADDQDFFGDATATANLLDQGDDADFFGGLDLGGDQAAESADVTEVAPEARSADEQRPGPFELSDEDETGMPLSLADPDEETSAPSAASSMEMRAIELGGAADDDGGLALELGDRDGEPSKPQAAAQEDESPFDSMDLGDPLGLDLPDLPAGDAAPAKTRAPKAPAKAPATPATSTSEDDDDFGGLDLPVIPAASAADAARAADAASAAGGKKAAGAADAKTKAAPKSKLAERLAAMSNAAGSAADDAPDLALDKDAVPQITHGIVASHHTRRHEAARLARRRRRIIIGVAVVAALGGSVGGYFAYTDLQQKRALQSDVQKHLAEARTHLHAGDPGHWDRAGQAAQRVLELDPGQPDALGIGAEAAYAALLEHGTRADELRRTGTQLIQEIDKNVAQGVHVDKAQALKSIDQKRPQPAIERLERVLQRQPEDPEALLYLGWAHAAARDFAQAAETFTRALENAPERKVPALYGLGQVRLAQDDHAGALKAFREVLSLDESHIGAQVGVAQVVEVEQSSEREALYMAILEGEDLNGADPRAVSHAWELAGYQALNAGRIEVAKRRFANAVDMSPGNVQALIGQGQVALLQDRIEDARNALTTVLRADPDHVEASLGIAELAVRSGQLDEAKEHVDKLIARAEEIEKSSAVRAYILRGRTFEAQEDKLEEAIADYQAAREIAGDDAIQPAVALAKAFTRAERPEEARDVLRPVHAKAANDPAMATTLGSIYLEAKAYADAEEWFLKALELRPDDTDAKHQLGRVLIAQKRDEEAISMLQGAFQADPSRVDIGVTLAKLFEKLERNEEAGATYAALLEAGTPSASVLARAGMHYASTGEDARAGELGKQILELDGSNAAGLFLRGVGEYHSGDHRAARQSFRDAVSIDPVPRYLEAQGRASEQLNFFKEAMDSYAEAAKRDPEYLAPRLGQVRLLMERREYQKALELLEEALAIGPDDAMVHFYIGVGHQALGRNEEAIASFRTSLRHDARHAETHYRIGRSYYDESALREAASAFDRATALAPEDAPWLTRAYQDLGYVQRSRSNRREAIRAWEKYLERLPEEKTRGDEAREVQRLLMGLRAQSR